MITKNDIIEIINNPNLGAVQLEFKYSKLDDNNQRKEFLDILKDILLNGSDKEKAICFTVIDMIGKASDFENFVKSNIENIKMTQSHSLINSLLWLAAALSKKWSINFIQQVIDYFKPLKDEYSYLYNMGVRSLISTETWRIAINEILWIIENYNNEQIVDFLAYFKWKHGEHDLEELFQLIKDNGSLTEEVNSLELKINERYISNYGKLSSCH